MASQRVRLIDGRCQQEEVEAQESMNIDHTSMRPRADGSLIEEEQEMCGICQEAGIDRRTVFCQSSQAGHGERRKLQIRVCKPCRAGFLRSLRDWSKQHMDHGCVQWAKSTLLVQVSCYYKVDEVHPLFMRTDSRNPTQKAIIYITFACEQCHNALFQRIDEWLKHKPKPTNLERADGRDICVRELGTTIFLTDAEYLAYCTTNKIKLTMLPLRIGADGKPYKISSSGGGSVESVNLSDLLQKAS
jgi:hypothetical protein